MRRTLFEPIFPALFVSYIQTKGLWDRSASGAHRDKGTETGLLREYPHFYVHCVHDEYLFGDVREHAVVALPRVLGGVHVEPSPGAKVPALVLAFDATSA